MGKNNILFIYLDQISYDTLKCNGNQICQTPHIDRLMNDGVYFDRAYTSCPLCSPARASVMTGQFPHNHKISNNVGNLGTHDELPETGQTLPEILGKAGYNLGHSGKWHLGDRLPEFYGFKGNNFKGHGGGGFSGEDYHQYLKENNLDAGKLKDPVSLGGSDIVGGKLTCNVEASVPYYLAETAINLLKEFKTDYQNNGKPFYVECNFWGPHQPCFAPEPYASMYDDADIPPWENFDVSLEDKSYASKHLSKDIDKYGWEFFAKLVKSYYAFTTFIDSQIGRMLDTLEELDLYKDTLIVFSTDHGGYWGHRRGFFDKGVVLYEETNRIPLIVKIPGNSNADRVNSNFVSTIDFMPTFLDYAGGITPPDTCEGKSLRPLLENTPVQWRDYAVTEFDSLAYFHYSVRAIVKNDCKLIFNLLDQSEFYDLSKDPHETKNEIDNPAYSEKVNDLAQTLIDHCRNNKDGIHIPMEKQFFPDQQNKKIAHSFFEIVD